MVVSLLKYLIIILVLLIIFVILYIYDNYQKLLDILENINTSKGKIDEILDKKKEYLEKLSNDSKEKELKIMLKEETTNIFSKEDMLFNVRWKLEDLINDKKYTPEKEYKDYYERLKTLEEDLEGLKDYYNSKVILYNEKYLNKVFCNIYKMLKLDKQKKFKLRKIESFEILKD